MTERPLATASVILKWLDALLGFLAVLCLFGFILDVLAGVIARYVFNASFRWTEEVGTLLFSWMIYIGFALGLRMGKHVSMSLLRSALPERYRPVLDFVVDIIVAYTIVVLMFSGWQIFQISSGVTPALQWPNWTRYFIIPGTCTVGLVYLVFSRADTVRRAGLGVVAVAVGFMLYYLTFHTGIVSMPATSPSLLMVIAFVVTLILGVPVAFSLLIGAYVATWGYQLLPPPAVVHNMVVGGAKFVLLAIPFFLTAGYLMNAGGLTKRLIDLALSLVGHFRGGLAQVNIVASLLLGGLSGSSSADAAGTSKVFVPEMIRNGYSKAFSCATTSASSILSNIIPPSIAMLIFASLAEVSVGRLFVAGIFPGIIMALSMMVTVYATAVVREYGRAGQKPSLAAVSRALKRAGLALLLPVFIIGSIRFGIMTATEAGVIAVLWAFFLGKFLYRAYSWPELYETLKACSIDAAIVGFLISVSAPFAWVLIAEQIPQQLIGWLLTLTASRIGILLLMNVVFLVLGTVLDTVAAMLITIPLFLPLMMEIGIDPIHFGIILIINLMLGNLTPPVGLLVFITSSIVEVEPEKVFREITLFLATLIVGLLLVTFVPELSLILAR